MRHWRLFAVVLVALLPLACSRGSHRAQQATDTTAIGPPTTATNVSSSIAIPTEGQSGARMLAAIRGTLNYTGGCFRIGSAVVVWPHGYRAATNPRRIIDDNGHVFARLGQVVNLGGGGAPTNLTPQQLVARYPPLRNCLPEIPCLTHPNPVIGCLNDLWFA